MHGFTDLQTQFCWKLIYMYVIRWCMSEIIDLTKNSISNCNLRQHAIFCKYIYEHCFDWSTTYIMSIIASNWQHCDQQQFRTLSCVHYTIFSSFFFFRKNYLLLLYATSVRPSVCPSVRLSVRPSVEIISFRGNSLPNWPIKLKIGLNVREGVVHVRKAWFFEILIASCKFMQFAIFCK